MRKLLGRMGWRGKVMCGVTAVTGSSFGGLLLWRIYYKRTMPAAPVRRTSTFTTGNDATALTPVPWPCVLIRLATLWLRVMQLLVRTIVAAALLVATSRQQALTHWYGSVLTCFTELGPTYIKLGQWLASRPDVFPPDLCKVLSKLFDRAPPHSWEFTDRVLRNDGVLGHLTAIETKPLNSGSVAQVHRGILRDDVDGIPAGTPVVVKVLHPNIRALIAADVAAMRLLVKFAEWVIPGAVHFDGMRALTEFSGLIQSQLDLRRECDNLLQFRYNFREFDGVVFPQPAPSLCTKDVIVETFEEGVPLQDFEPSKGGSALADVGCHMFLKMLFEDNFVHSDLHEGNLLVRTKKHKTAPWWQVMTRCPSELVVLDPGLVTTLSTTERDNFISLFAAVACGDGELGATLMLDRMPKGTCGNREQFKKEMKGIFDAVGPDTTGFRLSDVDIGSVLSRIMNAVRVNRATIDGNFAALVVTVMVGEGLGRKLQSNFNIFAEATPYMVKYLESSELKFLVDKLSGVYGGAALLGPLPNSREDTMRAVMGHWSTMCVGIAALTLGCSAQGSNTTMSPLSVDVPVSWKTYVFGVVLAFVFVTLMASVAPVFSILSSAAVTLYVLGIIDDNALFAGLINNGVLSIALLYVVVHPVVDLPMMKLVIKKVLGAPKLPASIAPSRPHVLRTGADALSPEMLSLGKWARFKVCLLSMVLSPFLENTPQTAMFTPLLSEHCRKLGLAPSQILMPMVYAVLLGNYFPLGFSSNLVVSGLMEQHGLGVLPLFELAKVNLPLMLPILLYLVVLPRYLLPLRRGGITFYARFKITHVSPLIGCRVADIFAHFIECRTESSEKIAVHRRSKAPTTFGRTLSWEKVSEPFCRLMVIEAGDEIVLGGLTATIGQPSDETASPSHGDEMVSRLYVSPSLGDETSSTTTVPTPQPSTAVTVDQEEIASRAAMGQAGRLSTRRILRGELETRLHEVLLSSLDETEGPQPPTVTGRERTSSLSPQSPRLSSRSFPVDDHRSHQARIRSICQDLGLMMMSVKVCFEGLNLLKDDVAFSKAPNLVATTRLLMLPPESTEGDSSAPSSPVSHASVEANQRLLQRPQKLEQDMTWAEWHEFKGGRSFKVSVPNWVPFGDPETIDEQHDEDPDSPVCHTTDTLDPHLVIQGNLFSVDEKKESKWKVVRLPWWYEYTSLLIFLGIVIASFFNATLSISCFIACVACVVTRLVSTKQLVKALPVEIYLLVAFSFPLGSGMQDSGMATAVGTALVDANVTGFPLLLLMGAVTLILTNMITSQGCVQVVFPLVVKVYEVQNQHPLPGIMMVLSTLSVALCTPFAIAPNAIILVPGGYEPFDYFKFGAPLSILVVLGLALSVATVYDNF